VDKEQVLNCLLQVLNAPKKDVRLQGGLPPFLVTFSSKSGTAFLVTPELISTLGDSSAGGLLRARLPSQACKES